MWSTIVPLLAVLNAVIGLEIPSFAPPSFEPSTIENDGTNVGRYDVRKTMAWLDPGTQNLNSYFFLVWLTTVDGRKYHVTLAPNFFRDVTTGIFVLNDLQNLTAPATGGTAFAPGTGSNASVNLQSAIQNFSSPVGGDNYTDLYYTSDFAGVTVDLHFSPTGKNLYVGGSGGITFAPSPASSDDYRRLMPGYSWYWANPTMRLNGTITIDGEALQIDHDNSFAFFERQTGTFGLPGGYIAFWLYLSNGLMVHSWALAPTPEGGFGKPAFATIWHPNGLHEVVEVDSTSTASDIWISEYSGKTYFNKFLFNMATRNASFNIEQSVRVSEATPGPGYQGYNISEAYGQGSGIWDGEEVTFFGHVEQLSAL